jgi:chaperonin GroES
VKYQAIGERLIVRRHDAQTKTASGIIIPENAQETNCIADVLSVGDEVKGVKAEDTIVFGKYAGTEVTLDGQKVVLLHLTDVLCVAKATGGGLQ